MHDIRRRTVAVLASLVTVLSVVLIHPAPAAASAGPYFIMFRHSAKCIDNYQGRSTNGNTIQQWTCATAPGATNMPNQRWYFDWTDNGWARIRNAPTGKCLNVTGNSTADGARLQLWTCGSGYNNQFKGLPAAGGDVVYYQVRARHSNKCIDLRQYSGADGGVVQQWSCRGDGSETNQHLTWWL
jgi:Ricin-type beta-trefoil lectin domain-like